jgi:CHAT domain-containing protein/Tfp pilus assembly protein PilF
MALRPQQASMAQSTPATPQPVTPQPGAPQPGAPQPAGPQPAAIRRYLPEFKRLQQAADWAGLERLASEALGAVEAQSGPDSIDVARAASWEALALDRLGRKQAAEPLLRRALTIDEAALGVQHRDTVMDRDNLADVLLSTGRYGEAEPLLRRSLEIRENALGPDSPQTASSLASYAQVLQALGRYGEAGPMYQRALTIDEKALGPQDETTLAVRNNFASMLSAQGRYREAEPLMNEMLRTAEARYGPDDFRTATVVNNLAAVLEAEGRADEAGPLYRRAFTISANTRGPDDPDTAVHANNYALFLHHQGMYAQADPLFRQAVGIDEKVLGPHHPDTRHGRENLAENDESMEKFDDAIANLRLACAALAPSAGSRDLNDVSAQAAQWERSRCSMHYSLALWGWAAQGGGPAPGDRPDALKLEAFIASQNAVQSAAGEALSRSAAFAAAVSASVGPEARAYEAALLERDGLDREYANAVEASGQDALERRRRLTMARDEVAARIERLQSALRTRAPRYWDFRSPDAVSVAALQATAGADAALLRADEALISFVVGAGIDQCLVFAVSKQQFAWARIPLSTDALQAQVIRLRQQIDPDGYRLRGIQVTVNATGGSHAANAAAAVADTASESASSSASVSVSDGFDRQAAYRLYQSLLGDASIQAVIRSKPVLLFVPSGPLTSLPPGLLVTATPPGGAARDADPAALRATAWLLRSKAVALLPAVSSLRTLRQIQPETRAATSEPLLAFVDPDFHRDAGGARDSNAVLRRGLPLGQIMDVLPDLPGTLAEGEALRRALGAAPDAVLLGRDASKAQLLARNADGRLAGVRVLEFATHALVVGDVAGLTEPALVLAAAARPEDALMLASDAATLRLNADWVLLSACNTASPDAPEAKGFSGLSRAFFYAGARSLLISHWEVLDSVAPLLIPAMLKAERTDPHLGHAQALRQASLAILDNPGIARGATPYAWAAFTLVGEAAR